MYLIKIWIIDNIIFNYSENLIVAVQIIFMDIIKYYRLWDCEDTSFYFLVYC